MKVIRQSVTGSPVDIFNIRVWRFKQEWRATLRLGNRQWYATHGTAPAIHTKGYKR